MDAKENGNTHFETEQNIKKIHEIERKEKPTQQTEANQGKKPENIKPITKISETKTKEKEKEEMETKLNDQR